MIKIINLAIIFLLGFQFLLSQDVILLNTGKSIKSKVLLVQDGKIYYKLYANKSNKVITINLDKIQNVYLDKQMKLLSEIKNKKDSSENIVIQKTKKNIEEKPIIRDTSKNKLTRIKHILSWSKKAKCLGLGTDIFFTGKNQRFTGLSLDFYISDNINTSIGYGYFQGQANPYATGTIILPLKNSNWSITSSYQLILLDNKAITNLEIFPDNDLFDEAKYNIYSLGMEYRDDTGLTAKFWIGTSFTKTISKNKYSGILFGFRIAGHIW